MTAITGIDATSSEFPGVESEAARSTVPVARRSCQFGVGSAFNSSAPGRLPARFVSWSRPGTRTGLFLLRMSLDMSAQDFIYLALTIQIAIAERLNDVSIDG